MDHPLEFIGQLAALGAIIYGLYVLQSIPDAAKELTRIRLLLEGKMSKDLGSISQRNYEGALGGIHRAIDGLEPTLGGDAGSIEEIKRLLETVADAQERHFDFARDAYTHWFRQRAESGS